ncbi:Rad17 cell cycle checkpoint protein-domain-containing protein [Mycena floridula]|nr:Rad17 cell cycle checkpoint protein-domain-containing protein [Mycena floridula]
MPPKSSQPSVSQTKKRKSALKVNDLNASSSSQKRINPLTAFASISTLQPSSTPKGKEKARTKPRPVSEDSEDATASEYQLWVDMYEPKTEADLAVHKRKVEDVRRWLDEAFTGGPSGKLRKYRRILALTGPSGTGKTTTVRILAREMGFEILEWRNAMAETTGIFDDNAYASSSSEDPFHEALFSKFEAFLGRASSCANIFTGPQKPENASPSLEDSANLLPKGQLILLEDLPNILHINTRNRFHGAIASLLGSTQVSPVPIIVIVSDAGMRGEVSDERLANGVWGRDSDNVVDIRTVLSRELLLGPYVSQIRFNPIAPTYLAKALRSLLDTHFAASGSAPSKEILDVVVESANGDIRSAIMALQFACIVELPKGKAAKNKGKNAARVVLESVTRREQSLALFHLIGKVLYNKRKGDPPSASATAKDIQKDKELDSKLKDSPKLPSFLSEHDRKASRVDVDLIYADSPIDSSLFSLYIHQNYGQFCNEIEEADGIADWLSWIDSSGGDQWYQANPHRFHLLTLGTLHSLPSPVQRRNQKVFKPEFFDFLSKEKDALDAVRDSKSWLLEQATLKDTVAWRAGGWSNNAVAMELGGVLKARDSQRNPQGPPRTHKLFSHLPFSRLGGSSGANPLAETDSGYLPSSQADLAEDDAAILAYETAEQTNTGGWLESDDIEEES